jgi:hypothetical protein
MTIQRNNSHLKALRNSYLPRADRSNSISYIIYIQYGECVFGSMNQNDEQCTRWEEIRETVDYLAQIAALIQIPTTFHLLNTPGAHVEKQEFSVADEGYDKQTIERDVETVKYTVNSASPSSVASLAKHVREIRDSIAPMADDLNNEGKKLVVILATDGLCTNESGVGGAMRGLISSRR